MLGSMLWSLVWFLSGILAGPAMLFLVYRTKPASLSGTPKAHVPSGRQRIKTIPNESNPQQKRSATARPKARPKRMPSSKNMSLMKELELDQRPTFTQGQRVKRKDGPRTTRGRSGTLGRIRERIDRQEQDGARRDSILMDPESRWRDHDLKRQWAQTLLQESMEPVVSRHLRRAIQSVLHFTGYGPENMDIQAASKGMGNWESLATPIILPAKSLETLHSRTVTSATHRPDQVDPQHVHPHQPSTLPPTTTATTTAELASNTVHDPHPLHGGNQPTRAHSEPLGVAPVVHKSEESNTVNTPPVVIHGFSSSKREEPTLSIQEPTNPPTLSILQTVSDKDCKPGNSSSEQTTSSRNQEHPLVSVPTANAPEPTSLPTSKPSILWSKVRQAVNGGPRTRSTTVRDTIYPASGSTIGTGRSMSDTHLPYQPTTIPSTSPYAAAALPSFSSSVLSLLGDDSLVLGQAITLRTTIPSPAGFETPPETAPGSPTTAQRKQSHIQHSLPGLSRRSSNKSPVVAAEVTTVESKISRFAYTGSPSGRSRDTRAEQNGLRSRPISTELIQESLIESLGVSSDISKMETTSSSSRAMARQNASQERLDSEITSKSRQSQFQGQGLGQGQNQDFDHFLNRHQAINEFGLLSPEQEAIASTKDLPHQALEQNATRSDSANGSASSSQSQERVQEREPVLRGPELISLINPTRQERRKSAISFGGYFSTPLPAARQARNQMDHSISGLESDNKGEVIHLRKTIFFEKSSPPALSFNNRMSLSPPTQRVNGASATPTLPSLTFEPVNGQKHHGWRSSVTLVQEAEAPSRTSTGLASTLEARKKLTPLKISALTSSGVTVLPSPMFPPPSMSIPRSILPDRYFYTVDQVHEWNIPSYGKVKFTDHAPMVFNAIRDRFKYSLQELDEAFSKPMTVMKTPGKSDAIFFASHNHGRFLLKTLRGSEPENLKTFLTDYVGHIHKHTNTLLPRYLGMYTFEKLAGPKLMSGTGSNMFPAFPDSEKDTHHHHRRQDSSTAQHLHLNGTLLSGKDDGLPSKLTVVILANVFDTPSVVHERYDFKGSNVGRRTLPNNTRVSSGKKEASVNHATAEDGLDTAARKQEGRHSVETDSGMWSSDFGRHDIKTDKDRPPLTEPKDDISHLTLKEVDFQNRVVTGESALIHLGSAKRSELLLQLEEDTALLRKHGFMDYSMLVGIRQVPRTSDLNEASDDSDQDPQQESRDSDADADGSNLASGSDTSETESNASRSSSLGTGRGGLLGPVAKYLKLPHILSSEQLQRLQELVKAAQEIAEEFKTMVQTAVDHSRQNVVVPEIPQQGQRSKHNKSKKAPGRLFADTNDECFDLDDFQTPAPSRMGTIRQTSAAKPSLRPSGLPAFQDFQKSVSQTWKRRRIKLFDTSQQDRPSRGTLLKSKRSPLFFKKHQPSSEMGRRSPLPRPAEPPLLGSSSSSWSQGVPSVDLPDGSEMVYYFGLIDILQKYNLVKWLERNFKGANVRLMSAAGVQPNTGAIPVPNSFAQVGQPAGAGFPLSHPPRSTPSTSSLYQLLPHATASEPSLPSALASVTHSSSTLSVLLEDPGSSHRPPFSSSSSSHRREDSARKRRSLEPPPPQHGFYGHGHPSIPNSKSAAARLSQSSQYSHSSQQSGSGSSATPDLLGSSSPPTQSWLFSASWADLPHSGSSSSCSSSAAVAPAPPPNNATAPSSSSFPHSLIPDAHPHHPSLTKNSNNNNHPQLGTPTTSYPLSQHAEVSVEEPGRYAERLVDFMRGVIV